MSVVINVVNKRRHKPTPHDHYCGRPSVLGNPYSHIQKETLAKFTVATRDEAIKKHEEDFYKDIENNPAVRMELMKLIDHLRKHGEINLLCWCAPASCHCDTIKVYLLNFFKS